MNKYILKITEGNKFKEFDISAENTEQALYEVDNTLQLYKGIEFIKNFRKSCLYRQFDSIVEKLDTKGFAKVHEHITVKRVWYHKKAV